MVTVRPNFQDSVHVGYVTGLKKFAEYYTSVLCFTTPGDGPRSPPKAVRTHEDSKPFSLHLSPLVELAMVHRCLALTRPFGKIYYPRRTKLYRDANG